jgi:hypothetical protein
VLRNDQGAVIAAAAGTYPIVAGGRGTGGKGWGALGSSKGATKVILETENATLVSLINSDEGIRSVVAGICHEIRELSLAFASFVCSHVNREGNEAAHLCARMPSTSSPVLSWLGASRNAQGREAATKDCNGVLQ